MLSLKLLWQLSTFDQIFLFYNGAKAGIETLQQSDPKLYERTHKIESLFFMLDLSCLGYVTTDLWVRLVDRGAFQMLPSSTKVALVVCVGVGLLLFAVVCVKKINTYFDKQNKETLPAACKWDRPVHQKIHQGMMVVQLVVTVALIAFSSSTAFCLIAVATQGCRLIKVSEMKWVYFESGEFSYFFLLQQVTASFVEPCHICKKKDPTTYLCPSHLVHTKCAIQHIKDQQGICLCPTCQQAPVALEKNGLKILSS